MVLIQGAGDDLQGDKRDTVRVPTYPNVEGVGRRFRKEVNCCGRVGIGLIPVDGDAPLPTESGFTCVCFLSPNKQNPKHTPSREARHITVGRAFPLC